MSQAAVYLRTGEISSGEIQIVKGIKMSEKYDDKNIRHLYDNVDLFKEDGRFYVLMGEEKLEINKEELLLILHDHEMVFNVVINAKRKHDFNTFMDRYSPMEY